MRDRALLTFVLTAALAAAALAADKWQLVTEDQGLPGNEIQFLSQDEAGTIWIGTLKGLAAFKNGKFQTRIKEGEIWNVFPIGPDKYWVGTANGVILLEGDKQTPTLHGSTVAPILPYGKGALWAIAKNRGTEQNVLVENSGGGWKPVERFAKERVVDLYRTSDGAMWVALDGNGIYAVNPAQGPDKAVHHLEGLNVTALAEDSKKRVWCGLWGRGVRVYENGAWTAHLIKEDSYVFTIQEDKAGTIWVATNAHGLWRHDGKDWVNDLREEGGINMLAATSDGKVWISSQMKGGLRYWDGKKWVVSLDSPLPIRCLLETKDGKVWAGGVLDGLHIKQ